MRKADTPVRYRGGTPSSEKVPKDPAMGGTVETVLLLSPSVFSVGKTDPPRSVDVTSGEGCETEGVTRRDHGWKDLWSPSLTTTRCPSRPSDVPVGGG